MKLLTVNRSTSLLSGLGLSTANVRFKNFTEQASFLRKRADEASRDQAIRELTLKVIFPRCQKREEHCQALAIGEWVQQNIVYVHEGSEMFQHPLTTVRLKAGDCDDHTSLICAMLKSVGIKNLMCLMKINGRWAHIFPVALVKVQGEKTLHRLTLDSTLDESIRDLVNPIEKTKAKGHTVETLFV